MSVSLPAGLPPRKGAQFVEQAGLCAFCSIPMTANCRSGDQATTDHLIPVERGGSNRLSNRVLACRNCNKRKGALLPDEMRAFADRIDALLAERRAIFEERGE